MFQELEKKQKVKFETSSGVFQEGVIVDIETKNGFNGYKYTIAHIKVGDKIIQLNTWNLIPIK